MEKKYRVRIYTMDYDDKHFVCRLLINEKQKNMIEFFMDKRLFYDAFQIELEEECELYEDLT